MAIRCSVFGCEYDDTYIEREEERRGDEVILTVREFKECANCGNAELISENTGVTSAAAVDLDDADGDEPTPDADEADGVEAAPDPDAGETIDAPRPDTDPATAAEDDSGPTVRTPSSDVEVPDGFEPPASDDPDPTPDPAETALEPDDEGTVTAGAADEGDTTRTDDGGTSPTDGDGSVDDSTPTDDAVIIDGDGVDPDDETSAVEDSLFVEAPEDDAPVADAESDAGDGDDAEFLDSRSERSTGGLDDAAAMEDGPSITGSIREAEEEFPEDDAVILTDSGGDGPDPDPGLDHEGWSDGDGGVDHGGWPDHDDVAGTDRTAAVPERGAWPDQDGTDEGYDATPDAGDGADVELSGLTPEADDADTAGSAGGGVGGSATTVSADRPLAGRSEAAEDGTPDDARQVAPAEDPAPDGVELFCSGCDYGAPREETAHRAGDICPNCSVEYLDQR